MALVAACGGAATPPASPRKSQLPKLLRRPKNPPLKPQRPPKNLLPKRQRRPKKPAAEAPAASGEGGLRERARAGESFSGTGTTVTWRPLHATEDEVKFDKSMKAFEEATGIDIQYEGTKEFEATIGSPRGRGRCARHRGLSAAGLC